MQICMPIIGNSLQYKKSTHCLMKIKSFFKFGFVAEFKLMPWHIQSKYLLVNSHDLKV